MPRVCGDVRGRRPQALPSPGRAGCRALASGRRAVRKHPDVSLTRVSVTVVSPDSEAAMATTPEHRSDLLRVIREPVVQQLLDEAKERISAEEGVSFRSVNLQFQRPVEHDFIAPQRATTTLLFGGFTFRHEYLIQCAFETLGY